LTRQLAESSDGLIVMGADDPGRIQVPAVRILISSRQFLGDPPLNPVEDAADLSKLIADSASKSSRISMSDVMLALSTSPSRVWTKWAIS
jgi:hypothetical protein